MTDTKRTLTKQDIGEVVETSMVQYAEQTILDRAIPDVRDGLKPVHRRILFAMGELNLAPNGKTLKCARIVGEVLGKYHPHGDTSVYGALVRMAQNWAMGQKLITGQGNFGSIDGDGAAAMRYTEAKLSEFGSLMLADIDHDTVDFTENFDGTLREPTVLPNSIPNLLVNGTSGIAVGMSTDVLPHNLNEVCTAVAYIANKWANREKITVDELMKIITGPDLPTGGLLYRYRRDEKEDTAIDMIRQAYETGYAPLICQAKADIEKNGKTKIIVTEIPFAVAKTTILERVAKVAKDGKLSGIISDVVDESDQDGLRIVFEVARGCDGQEALNALFNLTNLRTTLSTNHLALNIDDDGNMFPEILSLRGMLVAFIKHRLIVITRRAQFDKNRAEKRLHIVDALLSALAKIEEVIAIIKKSKDSDDAKIKLMKLLILDDIQAQAILDMQLRRLASLEVRKLQDEKKELLAKIKELNEIIGSEPKRLSMIIDEMRQINAENPTPRKTVIINNESGDKETVTVADLLVPEKPQMVAMTTNGIQRVDADTYKDSVQVGKASARAVETVLSKVVLDPKETVVLISNTGRLWYGNVGRLNSGSASDLGLNSKERLVSLAKMDENSILTIGTRHGNIKRIKFADVKANRNEGSWGAVIGLENNNDDEVLFVTHAPENAEIMFFTQGNSANNIDPRALRFDANAVNPVVSANARGVTAIAMLEGDPVLHGVCFSPDAYKNGFVVVMTDKGFAKKVKLAEFPTQGRAGKGVLTMKQNRLTGLPVAYAVANAGNALDLISEKGKRLRIMVKDIPDLPRAKNPENVAKKFDGIFGDEPVASMIVVEMPVESETAQTPKSSRRTKEQPVIEVEKTIETASIQRSKKTAEQLSLIPLESTTSKEGETAVTTPISEKISKGRNLKTNVKPEKIEQSVTTVKRGRKPQVVTPSIATPKANDVVTKEEKINAPKETPPPTPTTLVRKPGMKKDKKTALPKKRVRKSTR